MAECTATASNIVNSNDVLILVPIACPDSAGDIPDMYVLEGQTDGSLSATGGTVEDNEKRGRFANYEKTRLSGEISVGFKVYNDATGAVQDAYADHFTSQRLIPVMIRIPGKQYWCGKGRITSYSPSAGTDEGSSKVSSTVQLTGAFGKSTEFLK